MTAQEAKPDIQFVALDFVYCGRRWSDASNKLVLCIRPIKDGELQEAMLFAFDRKAHRTVGGVYSGAEFGGSSARGIAGSLRYERMWEDRTELIDWQARDEYAESASRRRKLEADAKKISEIERIMLPLRNQFQAYRVKRDHAGMEALRAAVLNALASAPRASEL